MLGTLYLVATPIGNLSDISFRAVEVLKSVDIIGCEDTRHTRKLLSHHQISNRLISYHEHNEHRRAEEFCLDLSEGKSIAIVSDAGTPGICDPSFRIVQKAHEIGVKVVAIPGAVAFVNAVTVSGLPTDAIFFGGFLPSKKSERRQRLTEAKVIPATLAFYESPHRLAKSLIDCFEVFGDRRAVVVRELTKVHEELVRGTLSELAERYRDKETKGEIVLVIDRRERVSRENQPCGTDDLVKRIKELEKTGIESKVALKKAAKEFGLGKSEVYRMVVLKKNK